MTRTLDDLIRAQDPAEGVDPPLPEHVLHRILAEPPVPAARRATPRRVRLAGAGALTATAAAAAVLVVTPDDGPGLLERAYAATSPAGEVVHTVRSTRTDGPAPDDGTEARIERWQLGDDVHIAITYGEGTLDQVVDDGRLKIRNPDGTILRSGEGEQGEKLADLAELVPADPVAEFREEYADDGLQEAGTTTFDGREVRRYVVPEARDEVEGRTILQRQEFLLDPDTAQPAGARFTTATVRADGTVEDGVTTTTTFETFERLRPTPEVLAQVSPDW